MRIIAGSAKGHTIKAPKGLDTRPTLDRVRESVFNVLSHRGIAGTTVLDLFSGTGAVAIEALSRGAAHAVAVDMRTASFIKENAIHCKVLDRIEILPSTMERAFTRLSGKQFNYIFADPPYEKGWIQKTIDLVDQHNMLAPEGVLLLERHNRESVTLPVGWNIIKEQKFGYTIVSYCVQCE